MDMKLKRLFDEAAIRDCMARYARGVDRMDRALIEGAYWEDGYDRHAHFQGSPREFADWVLGLVASDESTSHLLGQSLIRFEGERAAVETYYFARHLSQRDGQDVVMAATGRYADVFEERADEWRILEREVIVDWAEYVQITERQSTDLMIDDQPVGRRAPDDFSYRLMNGALTR